MSPSKATATGRGNGRSRSLRGGGLIGILTWLVWIAVPALAQEESFPKQRPVQERPPLPSYRPDQSVPLELPPVAPPSDQLSRQLRVFVRRFELVGNRVFSADELAVVTRPFENRSITSEELQEVRRQLTLYYVSRGYLNSGAVIPDQPVSDGVIRIEIIEGKLTAVEVQGNERLQAAYLEQRLRPEPEEPLNLEVLQERLQILQQNPLLERLNAELVPGIRPGEGVLKLAVRETTPYEIGVIFANNRPPSVGAEQAEFFVLHRNLTGHGDAFGARFGYGLDKGAKNDGDAFYSIPLTASDTLLRLWYQEGYSNVIDESFSGLNINSQQKTYGIGLSQPVYRTAQQTLALGLNLERQHSNTFLGDVLFDPTADLYSFGQGNEGRDDATVLQFSQDWLDRGLNQVMAARSVFSWGLDAFGASTGDEPNGRFVSWLGQFQWARRFETWNTQLIFRTDVQLTNDSLLPMEQCAVGGMNTVRGYRENQLVRDECFIASLEWRLPLFRLPLPGISRGPDDGWVQVAPFVDYGYARNKNLPTPQPKSISSAGLGLRWEVNSKVQAVVYWGDAFRNIDQSGHDLQDDGILFSVRLAYP